MDIGRVDRIAVQGTSALHRTGPVAKLAAFALVLVAVVASVNLLLVLAVAVSLLTVAVALRLPLRPLLSLAAYPAFFAALFALAVAPGIIPGMLIVTKAMTAALAAVLLMLTTPYPQVFAPLQKAVPGVIGDALLMTYRSFFLLLERFEHVFTAARLRAGLVGARPARSAMAFTRSLGGVLLYSIDLSQRTYDVMHLRGYDGRLVVSVRRGERRSLDAAVLATAAVITATALSWRYAWQHLTRYAWIPLLAAVAALGLAAITTPLRRTR